MEFDKPDIALVLLHYGDADVTHFPQDSGWRDIHCPFHDDASASARVHRRDNKFQCFACGENSGDSVEIIMKAEGLGFRESLEWARDNLGYEGGEIRQESRAEQYRPSWEGEGD